MSGFGQAMTFKEKLESSPDLCVKSFRRNAMCCKGMLCIPWLPGCTPEEAVKGAKHLGEVPLTADNRRAIRQQGIVSVPWRSV